MLGHHSILAWAFLTQEAVYLALPLAHLKGAEGARLTSHEFAFPFPHLRSFLHSVTVDAADQVLYLANSAVVAGEKVGLAIGRCDFLPVVGINWGIRQTRLQVGGLYDAP